MSGSKKDQVFPSGSATSNERIVAALIATALREEYGALGSAVKRIGRRIGAHPRAIRNWYEGRNAPNSVHLLLLAQSSPRVFAALLELMGRSDLLDAESHDGIMPSNAQKKDQEPAPTKFYSAESFTINLRIPTEIRCQLNQRQLWFLSSLLQGKNLKATHIVVTWGISMRSARTDIALLLEMKLVAFTGCKKTGKYMPQFKSV